MAVSRPSHPQLSRKSRELVSLPVARYTAHPLAAMAEQAADQGHAAMFAGFTSGTGRTHASHVITSWKFFEVAGHKVEQQEGAESFFGSLFGL